MRKRLRELEEQVGSTSAAVQQSASSVCAVLSRQRASPVNNHDGATVVARRGVCSKRANITQRARHRRTNTDQTVDSVGKDDGLKQSPTDSIDPLEATYDPQYIISSSEATPLLDPSSFWDLPTPTPTPGHPVINGGWPGSPDAVDSADYCWYSPVPDPHYGLNRDTVSRLSNTMESDKLLHDSAQDDATNKITNCLSGQTTLHLAAKKGHQGIVTMLLDRGSNVDDTDILGNSALHAAAAGGHQAVVQLLLSRGAAPELKDACGRTALHLAAENGNVQTVECLLLQVPDKEIYDAWGRTPLHVAIEWGHEDIVRLLLDNGADPRARVSP